MFQIYFSIVFFLASFCVAQTQDLKARQQSFENLIEHLVELEEPKEVRIQSYGLTYSVVVHNEKIRSMMRSIYSSEDLKKLDRLLSESTTIKINERGLVQAADRQLKDGEDPTNYNAVWLRDSLWAYLALNANSATKADAKRVLKGMLDYVSAEAQLRRFESVIADPSLVMSRNAAMEVVHIRFDSKSTDFQDVMVNNEPQKWNHKQNDALGLLLDLVVRAMENNEIESSELSESNWTALSYFPMYFSRIKYFQMEDAGPWEEIERTNSSSIGLVTSGLESLFNALYSAKPSEFARNLSRRVKTQKDIRGLKVGRYSLKSELKKLIDKGYERIFRQLDAGGESPIYKKGDVKLREADAALLNLIYPARLSRLKIAHKRNILRIIQPLIGRVGVKRYLNDAYQAGNYWFLDLADAPVAATGGVDDRTADASSKEAFNDRASRFIPATEAQWFFDSWISKCYGILFQESKSRLDRAEQLRFFNRALGQVTANTSVQGADGTLVPSLAFPESLNTVALHHAQFFVPSPITPLNWAKASYLLARYSVESN